MKTLPDIIILNILNCFSRCIFNRNVEFAYYRYYIGCWSLVSKQWNKNIINKVRFKEISIYSLKELQLLVKWNQKGFSVKNIYILTGDIRDIASNLIQEYKSEEKVENLDILVSYLNCIYSYRYKLNITRDDIKDKLDIVEDIFDESVFRQLNYYFKDNIYKTDDSDNDDSDNDDSDNDDSDNEEEQLLVTDYIKRHSILGISSISGFKFSTLYYTGGNTSTLSEEETSKSLRELNEYYKTKYIKTFRLPQNLLPVIFWSEIVKDLYIDTLELNQDTFNTILKNCPNVKVFFLELSDYKGSLITESFINHKHLNDFYLYISRESNTLDFNEFLLYLNNNNVMEKLSLNNYLIKPDSIMNTRCIRNSKIKYLESSVLKDIIGLWEVPSGIENIEDYSNVLDFLFIGDNINYHPNIKSFFKYELNTFTKQMVTLNSPNLIKATIGLSDIQNYEIFELLKNNSYIQSLSLFSEISNGFNQLVECNLPNLKEVQFYGCDLDIFNSLLKNKYICDAKLQIITKNTDNSKDVINTIEKFLFDNKFISKLSIEFAYSVGYSRENLIFLSIDEIEILLNNYYQKHPNPIIPDNLSFPGFKSSIFQYNINKYLNK